MFREMPFDEHKIYGKHIGQDYTTENNYGNFDALDKKNEYE